MAEFTPKKIVLGDINNGIRFTESDGVTPNAINDPIEAVAYSQTVVEHLTDTPDTSEIDGVGSPNVSFVSSTTADGVTIYKFKFTNLSGATFTPSLDEAGNLSWSNNRNLPNPPTINISGRDYLFSSEVLSGTYIPQVNSEVTDIPLTSFNRAPVDDIDHCYLFYYYTPENIYYWLATQVVDIQETTATLKILSVVRLTGYTPTIGENGNWFINGSDTGKPSRGVQGIKGDKGDKGDDGAAAGFGTPTAEVDATTGTPSVEIAASGPNTAKVFDFKFSGLKGESFSWEGEWYERVIDAPEYRKNDIVQDPDDKNLYIGIKDVKWTLDPPSPKDDPENWELFLPRGDKGAPGVVWMGEHELAGHYKKDDIVRDDDNLYICIKPYEYGAIKDFPPDDPEHWELFLPRGAKGAKGDKGDKGDSVTNATSGTVSVKEDYTITHVTFNFETGDSNTVEVKAKNGLTPDIGENGNWYIGNTDTGKPSRGEKGEKGATGDPGLTPTQIEQLTFIAEHLQVVDGKVKFSVELEAPSFNAATE